MGFPVTVTCLFLKCINSVGSNEKIAIVSQARPSVRHRLSCHCWTSYEGWSNMGMPTATFIFFTWTGSLSPGSDTSVLLHSKSPLFDELKVSLPGFLRVQYHCCELLIPAVSSCPV